MITIPFKLLTIVPKDKRPDKNISFYSLFEKSYSQSIIIKNN